MADFFIRNSLNPSKAVLCSLTYTQLVPKGFEGEAMWVLEMATNEPSISGTAILPEYINLTDDVYMEDEIKEAAERISVQVDWSPLLEDNYAPEIRSINPSAYEVSLETSVKVIVGDGLPSAGIDLTSITMTINDFDVTNELEITGDPYEYEIKWSPFLRIMDTYEGD